MAVTVKLRDYGRGALTRSYREALNGPLDKL